VVLVERDVARFRALEIRGNSFDVAALEDRTHRSRPEAAALPIGFGSETGEIEVRIVGMCLEHRVVRGAEPIECVTDDRLQGLGVHGRGVGLLVPGRHPERGARARLVRVRLAQRNTRVPDLQSEESLEPVQASRVVGEDPLLQGVVPERTRHDRRDHVDVRGCQLPNLVTYVRGGHPRQYCGMSDPPGDLRFDPLTREWVNVVGHRQGRPNLPADGCPFCPGGLEAPVPYDVRSFPNRWPALAPAAAVDVATAVARGTTTIPAAGASEVVLFSPQHDASLATLPDEQVRKVIDTWADRTAALLTRDEVEYVLVFENRGREVGATIDHPHGQIYGYPFVPPVPAKEAAVAEEHGCPICAEVAVETTGSARVVVEHGDWVAYVPFASPYPYGMRLAPRAHVGSLYGLDDGSRDDLAYVLREALARYDRLWPAPQPDYLFPYLLWFHQAPANGGDHWHVHAHTAPPLRAPGVPRYIASGELGSGTLANPVIPETAARELRDA